jgi:hypothetical protein
MMSNSSPRSVAARERSLWAHQRTRIRQIRERKCADLWNRGLRRPVTIDAATSAGHTNRTADVAADFERRQTRRECGATTTGAAARRTTEVPRIVRASVDRAIGLPVGKRNRDVRLAEQTCAGVEDRLRERAVIGRAMVFQRDEAGTLRQPRRLCRFLQRHRQSQQRTALPARERGIGDACGVARAPACARGSS